MEKSKVSYVIQYQASSGSWCDGHFFLSDADAFAFARHRENLVFPELNHRIIQRVTTQTILAEIEGVEQ
jgi:hypothetical protein